MGEWVVYNGPPSFTTRDRRQVEKRLTKYGVRPAEIEELFQREAENGEGIITVPIGLERLSEDGLWQPD
jgi:hypothetical protein